MGKINRKISNIEKIFIIVFLLMEIVIYIAFMYIDISEQSSYLISNLLKFIGIILCLLLSLVLYSKVKNKTDIYILRGALLFTVISDLFILILDYYTLGMITFCIVQLLYLLRLSRCSKELGTNGNILTRKLIRNVVIASIILCLLVCFKVELDLLVLISIFYFASIVLNAKDAIWIAYKSKEREKFLFALGMIMFLMCDINVGVFNLSNFVSIDGTWFSKIYAFATIAMWMFYLPAQVGIALSGDFKC